MIILAKTTSHKLYDANPEASMAAAILLGIGGAGLFVYLDRKPEIYHLNESHGFPLAFYPYSRFDSRKEVRKRLVFTNHTPEAGGNPKTSVWRLNTMGSFGDVGKTDIRYITGAVGDMQDHTLSALRPAGIANGVSKAHVRTLFNIWHGYENICPIISIPNAQNYLYWAAKGMYEALEKKDAEEIQQLKNRRSNCCLKL